MATAFDVIILGGGPAGYVCAIRAAQLGLATAVVERDKLGGVCVNIGCIPTKALLHSAYVARLLGAAAEFGVATGSVKTDYGVAMKRSRKVADQNSRGVDFLFKKHKITVFKGTGTLQPGRRVKVGSDVLEAKKAVVVATGSRVKGIPQIGLELNKTTVISSDEALVLEQAPASLAVIGAGAVGMEFADVFNAFGVPVTLIEALPRILPLEDAEASAELAKVYRKRGITVLAGANVTKATVGKDKVTLDVEAGGAKQQVEAAAVLMAAVPQLFTSTDPTEAVLKDARMRPNADAWFGRDIQGYDIYYGFMRAAYNIVTNCRDRAYAVWIFLMTRVLFSPCATVVRAR